MIEDVIGVGIVGGALAAIVQMIKGKFGIESNQTKILVVALSVIVGGLYVFARSTPWYTTILGVLAASQAVYALILK